MTAPTGLPRPRRRGRTFIVLVALVIGALPVVAPFVARAVARSEASPQTLVTTSTQEVAVRRGAFDATEAITGTVVADPNGDPAPDTGGPTLPIVAPEAGRVSTVSAQVGDVVAQGDPVATLATGGGAATFTLDPALVYPLSTGATLTFSVTNGPGPFPCATPRVTHATAPATGVTVACDLPADTPVTPGAQAIGTLLIPTGVQQLTGTIQAGRTTALTAPGPGRITKAPPIGQSVERDQVVAELALGGASAVVVAPVPADAVLRVHPTQIQVTIENGPPTFDCPYLGIEAADAGTNRDPTSRIPAPTPTPTANGYELRCRVPAGVVTVPGLTARLLVTTAHVDDALTLPRSAVEGIAPNGFAVKVGANGRERIPVGIGAQSRDDVQITSGLAEGDRVIDFASPGS